MNGLSFDPLIPSSLWLLMAVVSVALLAWYARRRPGSVSTARWLSIVSLMSAAVVMVLSILLNPTWSQQLPPPAGKPVLAILLDSSGSMATADVTGEANRFSAAVTDARKLAGDLADQFDVRIRTFDQTSRAVDVASLSTDAPVTPATDLAAAINGALTDDHPQGEGIVLLSDGIDNAGDGVRSVLSAVRTAKALAAPIYTKTFGGDMKSVDLAIEIKSPQDMAVTGQMVPLTARVSHTGLATGRVTCTLWSEGKEVARREVLLDQNGPADLNFMVSQAKVGLYPYEVRVEPFPGELSQANNSASYVLRVVNEPIRVLVLEGKPYWDSKFLTRTLVADPAVALDCVVRLNDNRLVRRTLSHATTAPTGNADENVETWKIDSGPREVLSSPDKLRGYQVIVLGRDAEAFLNDVAIANLQTWISLQGGSLLCYRGSPTATANAALSKLLPVKWSPSNSSRFRVALTSQGKDLNWFDLTAGGGDVLPRLPSLAASDVVVSAKPLAVVLAQAVAPGGTMSPALVYQPYGTGRVVVVEGAGMWRWAFLSPQYQEQDPFYASLWHSMFRWLTSGQQLAPGQMCSLRGDKVRFGAQETATATLLAREDIPREQLPVVQLTAPGNSEPKTFLPIPSGNEAGVFRIDFGKLPEGRYRAKAVANDPKLITGDANEIVFDVRQYDRETLDVQARPDLMARIADDSGGAVLTTNISGDVQSKFTSHLARILPPRVERTSAWDRWWVLAAVVTLWGTSWAVRRSGGLV